MGRKRDFVEATLNAVNNLLPVNEETRLLIEWLDHPMQTERLQRLAIETDEDDPVDAFLEAIEMELDAGVIEVFKDKLTRHQINWGHVENHLRGRHLVTDK